MNNGLIEALREKEKALRARIAEATAEQAKREAMKRKKLAQIIGGALIAGKLPPELRAGVVQLLASADLDTRQRRLLKENGWAV
jgi:hypothetical protein